jgi:hypothetical protein
MREQESSHCLASIFVTFGGSAEGFDRQMPRCVTATPRRRLLMRARPSGRKGELRLSTDGLMGVAAQAWMRRVQPAPPTLPRNMPPCEICGQPLCEDPTRGRTCLRVNPHPVPCAFNFHGVNPGNAGLGGRPPVVFSSEPFPLISNPRNVLLRQSPPASQCHSLFGASPRFASNPRRRYKCAHKFHLRAHLTGSWGAAK